MNNLSEEHTEAQDVQYPFLKKRWKYNVVTDFSAFVEAFLASSLCMKDFIRSLGMSPSTQYQQVCDRAFYSYSGKEELARVVQERKCLKISQQRKAYFECPEAREENSKRVKAYFSRPEVREECSKRMKVYHKEHRGARDTQYPFLAKGRKYNAVIDFDAFAEAFLASNLRMRDFMASLGMSPTMKCRQLCNGAFYSYSGKEELSRVIQERERAEHSKIMKAHSRHPEARKGFSKRMKAYFKRPEVHKERSDRLKQMHATGTGIASPEAIHNQHVTLGKSGSKPQNDLVGELKALGLNVIADYRRGFDNTPIAGHEIDIYLPDFNLGIEVNGEYWHSTIQGKGRCYHANKTRYAKENGIRLLQFWAYSEVKNNHAQALNKIKSLTSLLKTRTKVYARKCYVRKVDTVEVKKFLDLYHIQGYVGSTYYALYSKDGILLACMGFKKCASNTKDGKAGAFELTRYCSHPDYFVVGGFERLEKTAIRDLNPTYITSFADIRISAGEMYEHQGYTLQEIIKPDYQYFYKGALEHKFKFRINRFKEDPELQWEEGLTEWQLADLNGIPRCYDCGKLKYKKVINAQHI